MLAKKLERYPDQTISFAAVRGEVRAEKDCLRCGNENEKQDCVIRQRTRKELKSVFITATRQWHSSTSTISDVFQEVPLNLHRTGSSKFDVHGVRVQSPREAKKLPMFEIRERFLPVTQKTTMGVVTEFLAGEKIRGYQEIEKALPVGIVLTGIGELHVEDGRVTLCQPKGSLPYFLSTNSIWDIISAQRREAKRWKIVLFLCVIIGGACLLLKLYRRWKMWLDERRRQIAASEFALRQAQLRREARQHREGPTQLDNTRTCVVCWENVPDVVLLNCGHLCSCSSCVVSLSQCPICRSPIERFVPVFTASHDY